MQTETDFPHDVREVENVFIPMRDGTRLAARLWLPIGAEQQPVPALLEYLPYRKRDVTRGRDARNHPYLAGYGYACARVDMRGSGDSDGVLTDEYTEEEITDAIDVIAWLADQRWCDGNVGMFGISWGGFNSLQVAARRPPALKAIVSASATDDLYVDNMHYMGGCLLGDNLSEATVMFAFNSLPPDPAIVGDRWREMWHERLEHSGLWVLQWLQHQHRDAYWANQSVREDYASITCPVLAVGGWADGYTNAVFRLLEHLEVPRKGLIGPWGHRYPHDGVPGPAIGFLQELVRWWDHWLKGIDTGLMDEPMLRAWEQDSVPPETSYEDRPGRWIAEPAWPSPTVADHTFTLAPGRLDTSEEHGADNLTTTPPGHDDPDDADGETARSAARHGSRDDTRNGTLEVRSPLSVGMFGGKWASYAAVPDLPYDQREEDGGALVFETRPLAADVEVLGLPRLHLQVAADRPVAMVAARISDVAPDGKATRVTYGLLNLTHRDGHAEPAPLAPGEPYDVTVELNGIAQVFPAGHRIRLSLSSSYWPLAWPPPEPAMLRIHPAGSRLHLPVRTARPEEDTPLRELGPPEGAPPLATEELQPSQHRWRVQRDLADDETVLEIINDQGAFRIEETGTIVRRDTREWYGFTGAEVNSVWGETRTVRRFERDDWRIEVTTRTVLTSTPEQFHVSAQLDAYELDGHRGHPRVHSQSWDRSIPRRLV